MISDRLTFLIEYLDIQAATDIEGAAWEPFQTKHLNTLQIFAITNKSRQVGFSWAIAADAVASACLNKRDTNIFVSINQDEAKEKIRYATYIIEALDPEVRPKLLTNNALEIELANGSRLIGHPQRPLRGKAKANVYLDEFAHYRYSREIYKSAIPSMTKGGRLRIGSSPLGATGLFWEIYTEAMRKYPGYRRQMVPWWATRSLCKDLKEAGKLAPFMPTPDRVALFGTTRLQEIFENMILEDFQQEYECSFVDEAISWISWDEIQRNQDTELLTFQAKDMDSALAVIDEMAALNGTGKMEYRFAGGMDVGRVHDRTEIVLLGKTSTRQTPYRLGISLGKTEFDAQEALLDRLLTAVNVESFLIDRNGLGMELAEKMEKRHPITAIGVNFTNENKATWARGLKLGLQKMEMPLPPDRDLAYQLHSIRRKVLASASISFDTEKETEHHADKFWALALARAAAVPTDTGTSFAIGYA
jgi:phage FluMu gp28-like protein